MDEEIHLSDGDGIPRVVVRLGSPSFASASLFLKAPGSGQWRRIFRGDNVETPVHTIDLDPQSLEVGDDVGAFNGWRFGWFVTFLGFGQDDDEAFELSIEMSQNSGPVLNPPFQKSGTFNAPSKSFNGQRRLVVS